MAKRLIIRELVDPVWDTLAARGFARIPSGGYRLGALPVHAFLDRQRWVTGDAELPEVDWCVFLGSPGAAWQGGRLLPSLCMLGSLSQQASRPGLYRVDTPAQRSELANEFVSVLVPVVDLASDPAELCRSLVSGSVAPFGGRKHNRVGGVDAALTIARALGIGGLEEESIAALISEAAISPTRNERALSVAAKFDLDLGPSTADR